MSVYSVFVAVLAFLLLAFSASQLGLASYVLHYISYHVSSHQSFVYSVNPSVQFSMYYLPVITLSRSYVLQVATGVLGIIIALVVLGLSFRSKSYSFVISGRRAPRSIAWPGVSIALCVLLFLLAFPTIVITFFDNAHFGQASVPASTLCLFQHGQRTGSYTSTNCGSLVNLYYPFTVEAWTCSLYSHWMRFSLSSGNEAREPLQKACQISTYSRWWTIPVLVLPLLIVILALFEIRRKNMERFDLRQQHESYLYPKDHQQSVSSAEEAASANSPVSPIGTLPQYSLNSELHSQSKADAEMGGKQVVEAPEKMSYDEMPAQQHQVYNELSANRSNVAVAKS